MGGVRGALREGPDKGAEGLVGAGAGVGEYGSEGGHPAGHDLRTPRREGAAPGLRSFTERVEGRAQEAAQGGGVGGEGWGCGTHGRQGAGPCGALSGESPVMTRTRYPAPARAGPRPCPCGPLTRPRAARAPACAGSWRAPARPAPRPVRAPDAPPRGPRPCPCGPLTRPRAARAPARAGP
ncbi:hypothetical protein GCM10010222_29900 [Streptomyces tanashiensis]|nr:hypothetical protein GCM10010222_29900 [Streptomyces tanashiensis]